MAYIECIIHMAEPEFEYSGGRRLHQMLRTRRDSQPSPETKAKQLDEDLVLMPNRNYKELP